MGHGKVKLLSCIDIRSNLVQYNTQNKSNPNAIQIKHVQLNRM